jgi:Heterokaryon incompatibility protein (HET)
MPVSAIRQRKTIHPAFVDASDIRLLHLSKGGPDDPIHGNLKRANLRHLLPSHQFEALSYTWTDKNGNSTRCRTLFLGPAWDELLITASCDAALRQLRYQDREHVLWVDSICINQEDNEERSHQVRKMCEIYAAAFRVMIYLGGDDADSSIVMGIIAGAHDSHTAAIGDVKQYAVSVFQKFFEHPYFSRIWIIEEIAMVRSAIVYCGADYLGWSKFQPSALREIGPMDVFPS